MAADTEKTNGRGASGVDDGSEVVRERDADGTEQAEAGTEAFSDAADGREDSGNTQPANSRTSGNGETSGGDSRDNTDNSDNMDSPDAEPEDKPWKTQRNAKAARERRAAEAKAALDRAVSDARVDAILEALDRKNPYTGETMKDAADVEVYLTQKRIRAAGGDPVRDFARELAEQRRQSAAEKAQAEQADTRSREDVEAFRNAFPSVDLGGLLRDREFADYAEGKIGAKPLADIYRGYTALRDRYRNEERERAAQALANARSSPGSVTGKNREAGMTREQLLRRPYDERARFARENPEAYRTLMGR